jgi:hypothetical protein
MFTSKAGQLQSNISGQSFNNLGEIINKIVPYILATGLVFVFIYLIIGGFGIMTSKADPKSMDAAKQKITYAIVGFIIIFTAFWIVQLLGLVTGIGNFGGVVGGSNQSPPTP